MTIAQWLHSLELGQYARAFEENHLTVESLGELTNDDLRELGVASLGHRKKLLAEIAKLASAVEKPATEKPAEHGRPARELRRPAGPLTPALERVEPTEAVAAPVGETPKDTGGTPMLRGEVAAPPAPTRPEVAFHSATSPVVAPPQVASTTPAVKRPGFWVRVLASKFLFVSIVAHLLFGVGATYFIVQRIAAKRKVTFQGGPPSANPSKRALEHKVSMAQKKKTGGAPPQAKRIVTAGLARISLPDLPTISTASTIVPGMMAGMGGAGFGTGVGFGSGMGSGMGGGGGGGGGFSFFGFRGAGAGLHGTFYDLKQTRDKKPSGVNANNYTGIVRSWVADGMKESALAKYFKAPATLSASQFMIPDMLANEAPKAYGVEDEVKPAQWLAVYRGKVQPPREGTYHFIGAADDVLLVRINGKLVLDASWQLTSSLQAEAVIPPQYVGFPRKGYIKGEAVRFGLSDWAEMEVVIGERPGGRFWAVLMAVPTGSSEDNMPLFRTAAVKVPETKGAKFPKCDLNGPLWRGMSAGGSLLEGLKRP